MKGQVPPAILDPILKEAAALAKLDHEQLVIVRAQSPWFGMMDRLAAQSRG